MKWYEKKNFLYNEFSSPHKGIRLWGETPIDYIDRIKGTSSIYIWEFNILVKAKIFLENKSSEKITLDKQYKDSYDFWQKRQVHPYTYYMNSMFNLKSKGWHFNDYTEDKTMYTEICADLVWVGLHLVFYKSVLEHLINNNIKLHYIDEHRFDLIIKGIINSNYKLYKPGYECHEKLSCFKGVNQFSTPQIVYLYNYLTKYNLDVKLKDSSYKFFSKGLNLSSEFAYKRNLP